jgi:AcrR family transcriptional regulator
MKHTDTCRDRLLAAGRAEFHRQGYDGASVRTITAKARANLGAVTYHFGSKSALYHAVVESITGPFVAQVAEAASQGGAPLERIERILRAFLGYVLANPEIPAFMAREMVSSRQVPPPVARAIQHNLGALAGAIAEGQRDGSIRAGDVQLMAVSTVSQPFHFAFAGKVLEHALGLRRDDHEARRRVTDHIVTMARAMLAAPPAAAQGVSA